jgi:formylglycine-generating enzyme required for sulfatase activity
MGVGIAPLLPEAAQLAGLAPDEGVLVTSVAPEGGAARAEIRVGDIILTLNGERAHPDHFSRNVAELPAGSTAVVTLLRGKRQRNAKVVLQSIRYKEFAPCPVEENPKDRVVSVFDFVRNQTFLSSVGAINDSGQTYYIQSDYRFIRNGDKLDFEITDKGTGRKTEIKDPFHARKIFVNGVISCFGSAREIRYFNRYLDLVTAYYDGINKYYVSHYAVSGDDALRRLGARRVSDFKGDAEGLFTTVANNLDYFVGQLPGEVDKATAPTLREEIPEFMRPAATARGIGLESRIQTASTNAARAGVPVQRAGATFRDCPACPEMTVLPAGSFAMGSPSSEEGRGADEGPVRQVTFARPFAMGRYEVTYDEWNACVAAGGCRKVFEPEGGGGRRPVAMVSWYDARSYADWLSRETGQLYSIPSEAEWEYAARAGTNLPWNTGDGLLVDDANIMDQFKQSVPVGGFPPNAFGLYDMHGNVFEWVLDCIDVGYFGAPSDGGAAVKPMCPKRGLRGGGWKSEPNGARSANREAAAADHSSLQLGFRVTRAL